MDYTIQDHDTLVEVHTLVKRMDTAINGDGDPTTGLISRVATIEGRVADIDTRAPSTKEKKAVWGAIVVALVTGLSGVAVAIVGR